MQLLNKIPTASYLQDKKHATKSDKFVAIKPADIGLVLADHGFSLAHLKTGRARLADRAAHQTTIARYRSDKELKIKGHYFDIVFKVPHLYGSLQAFIGTYREICANGLVVGDKFFDAPRIRHQGDALNQLDKLIPDLVAKHDKLAEQIYRMRDYQLNPTELSQFVSKAVSIRLGQSIDSNKISWIDFRSIAKIRRPEDNATDLYTVLNVVQENLMRFGFRYQTQRFTDEGRIFKRYNTARPLTKTKNGDKETLKSIDVNQRLWAEALNILAS